MQLADIVKRTPDPEPWSEGDKIPWNDPDFSERMLREHLSQSHDLASRRLEVIEAHVAWIHERVLERKPARILDLGCGPGLYASRLATLGHQCVGVDFSPASIRYATEHAARETLACTYVHEDIRTADFGAGFELVMFLFGELNVFRPADAGTILAKANGALAPGGTLLLEPHQFDVVEKIGTQAPSWHTAEAGLFSEQPHLWLQENSWNPTAQTATTRFFVIDAATGEVHQLTQTMQAYTDQEYGRMLEQAGFAAVKFLPSFGPSKDQHRDDLMLIEAKSQAGAQP
jgi:SAM-dependent methyltransferase